MRFRYLSPSSLSRCRGSALVETSLTIPFFIITILLGIELARVSLVSAQLQRAVNSGARYASLFRVEPGFNREESIARVVSSQAALPLNLSTNISICQAPLTNCPTPSAGVPRQLIAVTARYNLSTVFGGLTFPLTATAITRNEPFQ